LLEGAKVLPLMQLQVYINHKHRGEMMQYSKIYIPTVKDAVQESEALNYRLLHKAGYARKNAAGIFSLLPLGNRVLQRLISIIEDRLEAFDIFEIFLSPTVSIEDFYKNIMTGKKSAKELSIGAWHRKTNIVEGIRPRLGLLQPKVWEAIEGFKLLENMDALNIEHNIAVEAYRKIMRDLNVDFIEVEQLSWKFSGEWDKVFLLPYENGEDSIVRCTGCGKSTMVDSMACEAISQAAEPELELKMEYTPQVKTIAELTEYLGVEASDIVKTLIYKGDDKLYGVLIKGNRELSEAKLKKTMNCHVLRPATAEEVFEATNSEVGFAGPIGLKAEIICDYEVAAIKNVIVGANKTDYHYMNVVLGRDFEAKTIADLRNCDAMDKCPECGVNIQLIRGFSLGQVRKIGSSHTNKQELMVINNQGSPEYFYILDFELNLFRILAAVVEANHDDVGLVMPRQLAPFDVVVMAVHSDNEVQTNAAIQIYEDLNALNYHVLLDDRIDRVSLKFKDSELIGIPLRITVGRKINEGIIELKYRNEEMQEAHINNLTELLLTNEAEHVKET